MIAHSVSRSQVGPLLVNAGRRFCAALSTSSIPDIRDTIIIGSGPAGYTAALYTARANLRPLMIAGVQHGGQLQLTSDVENFPGYAEPISGPDLMTDLMNQAKRFGTEMLFRDVTSLDVSSRPFKVISRKNEYFARSIIVATGAEAIWLGAEGEDTVRGRGVSTCATCDGAFFKDQEVIVVGGGDSAMEESLFLTKFASKVKGNLFPLHVNQGFTHYQRIALISGLKVTLVHRRDYFRASKIMHNRVMAHPKIEVVTHRIVKRWITTGEESVLVGAELVDPRDGNSVEMSCSGAFIAIGHRPMTSFLKVKGVGTGAVAGEAVELDEEGFILHKQHTMTNVEGVFACGDVVDKRYRQAITAAGMGCQAAMDCERWLAEG